MKKLMFVCLGNICRSPLAHAVFEHIADENGRSDAYQVDSSGTTAYHAGERADERMRMTAKAHGVSIRHRAQGLTPNHIKSFDYVLCMDEENRHGALRLAKTEADKAKIKMLRDFDPDGPGNVPDPYYGGQQGFENVFQIVDRSCRALFNQLEADEK